MLANYFKRYLYSPVKGQNLSMTTFSRIDTHARFHLKSKTMLKIVPVKCSAVASGDNGWQKKFVASVKSVGQSNYKKQESTFEKQISTFQICRKT